MSVSVQVFEEGVALPAGLLHREVRRAPRSLMEESFLLRWDHAPPRPRPALQARG